MTGLSLIPATAFLDKVNFISIFQSYVMSVQLAAESSNALSSSSSYTGLTLTSGRYFLFQFVPTIDTCEPVSHSIEVSTPLREAQTRHLFPSSLAVCHCLPVNGALKLNKSRCATFGRIGISILFALAEVFLILQPDAMFCTATVMCGYTVTTSSIRIGELTLLALFPIYTLWL